MNNVPRPLRALALVACLATGAVLNGGAQAQPRDAVVAAPAADRPSPADVDALMALEDWPGKLAGLRDTFAAQMQRAVNSPAWKDLSPQARERMGQQLAEVMAQHFAWPGSLAPMLKDTYLTQVAAEDVATLLSFHGSDDGQWLIRHLQPVLDQLEAALQDQGRQDLDRLTAAWMADATPQIPPEAGPPAWQPANSHEAAAHRLLTATSLGDWTGQIFQMRLGAIDRFTSATNTWADRPARFQGFTAHMRSAVALEVYLPQLVAQMTRQLTEEDLGRALRIEASAPRQKVRAVDQRVGQVFGQRMQAWQNTVLLPALREVMQATRRTMPR